MCPAQLSPQHSVIPVEWKMRGTHSPTFPDPKDPQAVRTLWCGAGSPVGSSDRGGLWGPVQEGAGVDEEQMLGKAGGPRGSPFPGLHRAVGGRGRLSGERDMSPGVAASCGTPRLPGTPPGAGSGVWVHTHTRTHARAKFSVHIPVTLGRWQEVSDGKAAAGNPGLAPLR